MWERITHTHHTVSNNAPNAMLPIAASGTCQETGSAAIRVCFERDKGAGLVGIVELRQIALIHDRLGQPTATGGDGTAFGGNRRNASDGENRWWLLRAAGPHPQTALFEASEHDPVVSVARFRVCGAGQYTLHVRELLRAPWAQWEDGDWTARSGAPPPCMRDWSDGVLLHRHAFRFAPPTDTTSSHSKHHRRGESLCGLGLWRWKQHVDATTLDAHRAHVQQRASSHLEQVHPAPYPNRTDLAPLFSDLTYVHDAGDETDDMYNTNRLEEAEQTRICLLGDSQMRTLNDALMQLVLRAAAASRTTAHVPSGTKAAASIDASLDFDEVPGAIGGLMHGWESAGVLQRLCRHGPPTTDMVRQLTACPKNMNMDAICKRTLCPNVTAHYIRANYGSELLRPFRHGHIGHNATSLVDYVGSHCSAVLFNTGQWWATSKPGKPDGIAGPATPGRYAAHLRSKYLPLLRSLADTTMARVAFVATNPYPLNAGGSEFQGARARAYNMALCPPGGERRFPHVLHAYNARVRDACSALRIQYLDTYRIALPLFDVSSDGAHYPYEVTPVGAAQAARVLRWLTPSPIGASGTRS